MYLKLTHSHHVVCEVLRPVERIRTLEMILSVNVRHCPMADFSCEVLDVLTCFLAVLTNFLLY